MIPLDTDLPSTSSETVQKALKAACLDTEEDDVRAPLARVQPSKRSRFNYGEKWLTMKSSKQVYLPKRKRRSQYPEENFGGRALKLVHIVKAKTKKSPPKAWSFVYIMTRPATHDVSELR